VQVFTPEQQARLGWGMWDKMMKQMNHCILVVHDWKKHMGIQRTTGILTFSATQLGVSPGFCLVLTRIFLFSPFSRE
jgi:hypothetical protein